MESADMAVSKAAPQGCGFKSHFEYIPSEGLEYSEIWGWTSLVKNPAKEQYIVKSYVVLKSIGVSLPAKTYQKAIFKTMK